MQKYTDIVQDTRGNAISGATVTIKDSPSGATSTTYASDAVGANTNPLTTDGDGRYTFYAKDGNYYAAVSKPGITAENGPVFTLKDQSGWVSVKGYGAVGDGVTDDTVAIQAALTAALFVCFPAGTYKTTADLITRAHHKIWGAGAGVTTITPTGAGIHGFREPASGAETQITISDLTITGGATTGSGIYFPAMLTYESVFRNLHISMGSHAVYMQNEFQTLFDNVLVNSSTGHGFFVNGGNTTTFLNCYAAVITTAGKAGFRSYGGGNFISCNGVNSSSPIWGIFGATNALDGTTVEYNCLFTNCNVEDFSDTGMIFRNAGYAKIDGGFFLNAINGHTCCIDSESASNVIEINGPRFIVSGTKTKLANVFSSTANQSIFSRSYDGTAPLQIDENGTLRYINRFSSNYTAWTPALAGSATAGTNTYSLQEGWYRVDGRTVTANFAIILTGNSVPMVGNLIVTGLPYAAYASLSSPGGGFPLRYNNITLGVNYRQIGLFIAGGATSINIQKSGDNVALAAVATGDINATTGYIYGQVQYQI